LTHESYYILLTTLTPTSYFNIFIISALTAWPLPKILSDSIPACSMHGPSKRLLSLG